MLVLLCLLCLAAIVLIAAAAPWQPPLNETTLRASVREDVTRWLDESGWKLKPSSPWVRRAR